MLKYKGGLFGKSDLRRKGLENFCGGEGRIDG